MTITAAPLETLVTQGVLYRLDTPELADALAGRERDDEASANISEAIAADAAQMEELAAMYAAKAITGPEWLAARKPIEARLTANRRRQAHRAGTPALAGHVGNGTALSETWPTLNLTRQSAIIRAVIDHVSIKTATPGVRHVDPSRVEVTWRL